MRGNGYKVDTELDANWGQVETQAETEAFGYKTIKL